MGRVLHGQRESEGGVTSTSIAWVLGPDGAPGYTWNPVAGFRAVSKGCENCWAARLASTRLAHLPEYRGLAKDGKWDDGARFLPDRLAQPLRCRAEATRVRPSASACATAPAQTPPSGQRI
jgi:protein gp37